MEEYNFDAFEAYAKIVVIGVGGAGNNAVNKMIDDKLNSIDFWVCNTDVQTLANSKAEHRFVLGKSEFKGLGAGGDPSVGQKSAEESIDDIKEVVEGADIVFIAAGMGGGTGTGASPVIARCAKDAGALTLAIVTRPFKFEGPEKRDYALDGINKLKENVDAYLVVSNDKLRLTSLNQSFINSFEDADKVLSDSVKTIVHIITSQGHINLDFKDVYNLLKDKGLFLVGNGEGHGEKKAFEAANSALTCPLVESTINGAKSVLMYLTISPDVTMADVDECQNYIQEATKTAAKKVVFGVCIDHELEDTIYVSLIATDIDESQINLESEAIENIIKPIKTLDTPLKEEEEENILPAFIKKGGVN